MNRRTIALPLLVAAAAALPRTAAAAPTRHSWAQAEIVLDTARGVFPGRAADFRPNAPLTVAALRGLVARLTGARIPTASDEGRGRPVSVARLDASLVDALGLEPAAVAFQQGARRAGLDPPSRFGSEVVARLLGLRAEHPASEPALSLRPQQTVTRAEAAYSVARVLELAPRVASAAAKPAAPPAAAAAASGPVAYVGELASGFRVPALSAWQRRVLRTAVSFVGYPYFLGGDDEKVAPGFDCSGLVWRVYRLARYPGASRLARTLGGRTAAAMAVGAPRSERIRRRLEPGDVLFFGAGRRSTRAQIDHTAIYLGRGWLIESASQGVSLGLLSWFRGQFAWARRPLAEAGLEAAEAPGSTLTHL
jgi:cell wall-associated NlpC family hydrolase